MSRRATQLELLVVGLLACWCGYFYATRPKFYGLVARIHSNDSAPRDNHDCPWTNLWRCDAGTSYTTTNVVDTFTDRAGEVGSGTATNSSVEKRKPIDEVYTPIERPVGPAKRQRLRRVFAVGDVHGDLMAWQRALQLSGVIPAQTEGGGERTTPDADPNMVNWCGGDAVVVQLGDLISDSTANDRAIVEYTGALAASAAEHGGQLHVVLGDHDLAHLQAIYKAGKVCPMIQILLIRCLKNIRAVAALRMRSCPYAIRASFLLQMGESPPDWLSLMVVFERTLFVHGSLLSATFRAGGGSMSTMNDAVRAHLQSIFNLEMGKPHQSSSTPPDWLVGQDSPLWSRKYAADRVEQADCSALLETLQLVDADRMVIGHTVRREGISSACKGRVWRVDVGLAATESFAGKGGKVGSSAQVLEMTQGSGDLPMILGLNEARMPEWTSHQN